MRSKFSRRHHALSSKRADRGPPVLRAGQTPKLVGARGFEPPTPSLPEKDADSDIHNYINVLIGHANMFSGFSSGLLNLLEPGGDLLVENVGIFQRRLEISVI